MYQIQDLVEYKGRLYYVCFIDKTDIWLSVEQYSLSCSFKVSITDKNLKKL